MIKSALPLALVLPLALAACDKPKERAVVPPLEAGPVQAATQTPAAAPSIATAAPASKDLPKRPELAGFSLDVVNDAPDPINRPATIPSGAALTFSGFALDPVAKAPAKGVDIVLDGVAYGTTYGHRRQDVADYFKVPALDKTGFTVVLPARLNTPGPHKVLVRVVAADGAAYFDGVEIPFYAK